jgi:hypothetical protein
LRGLTPAAADISRATRLRPTRVGRPQFLIDCAVGSNSCASSSPASGRRAPTPHLATEFWRVATGLLVLLSLLVAENSIAQQGINGSLVVSHAAGNLIVPSKCAVTETGVRARSARRGAKVDKSRPCVACAAGHLSHRSGPIYFRAAVDHPIARNLSVARANPAAIRAATSAAMLSPSASVHTQCVFGPSPALGAVRRYSDGKP